MTGRNKIASKSQETAGLIIEQIADCGIELVASLPDNWISDLIRGIDADDRFRHVPVNREESALIHRSVVSVS